MTEHSKPARNRIATLQPSVAKVVDERAPARLDTSWGGQHQGSAKDRGYGGDWKRRRLRILKRDGYICQCTRCKADGVLRNASEVDHVIPKQEGGDDGDDNLQAINVDCHRIKTAAEAARGVHRTHGSRDRDAQA